MLSGVKSSPASIHPEDGQSSGTISHSLGRRWTPHQNLANGGGIFRRPSGENKESSPKLFRRRQSWKYTTSSTHPLTLWQSNEMFENGKNNCGKGEISIYIKNIIFFWLHSACFLQSLRDNHTTTHHTQIINMNLLKHSGLIVPVNIKIQLV